MSDTTGIEWTDSTWNVTTGCDRVSEGCAACYALDLAARLKAMGNPKYQTDGEGAGSGPGFGLALHPDTLDIPLRWRRPRRIFVDSMSDLFHAGVPDDYIAQVFGVMALARRHQFQVLTKRPGRMASLLNREGFVLKCHAEMHRQKWGPPWPDAPAWTWPLPNVWVGTSVETQRWADVRLPNLLRTPAAVRFLSCEPLLGALDLRGALGFAYRDNASGQDIPVPAVDWVIVGGESGRTRKVPGGSAPRPMYPEWPRAIRDQCGEAGVAFLFKQWGSWSHGVWPKGDLVSVLPDGSFTPVERRGTWPHVDGGARLMTHRGASPKSAGRHLDGRTWDEMPRALRVSG